MPDQPPKSIVIVDDDSSFAASLAAALAKSGYAVTRASDVRDAYSLLGEGKPLVDVVIIDLDLPDKSGLELIHTLNKRRTNTRIMATTGVLSDLHLEIATYMGATLALRKFSHRGNEVFPERDWIAAVRKVLDMDLRGAGSD